MTSLNKEQERGQWGSKIGFILAAAGSAVGLGNLWKFPYMAGKNGGGAFVLVYIIILFLVGFTLMLAEITLGRHTQLSAIGAYRKIREKWAWVGGLGVIAGFLILSFYSVVGGWVLSYLFKALTGALHESNPEVLGSMFGQLISSTTTPIIFHAIFMALNIIIVFGGISGGIEKASKIMMPALFIMIILLAVRSVTLPGAAEGLKFLFVPKFSAISTSVVLDALGQVFFSLSLGMGCMITYGSYIDKDTNLIQSATAIPLIDTGVALLAGIATLPAVFAFGFEPAAGPGLMFVTLPAVFSQMPLGGLFAVIFFLLVLFAALTSSISLLEVCVAYVVDEWKWNRGKATTIMALIIFLVGIPASLSLGPWANIHILPGRGFFDTYDFIASNVLLPLGGLLLCIFVGWIWGTENAIKEATSDGKVPFSLASAWVFLIKYVGPLAIGIVFVRSFMALFS
ncbi:sodium-dependent transporter [Crassaminicella thermophila]|uniref:Transporter n=1 Tax=Crassaminicella thermophila TaxID=2599308 RepID=A0A5C0SFC7_CRATE|nr:sodium-dependent transporter [Crassaminicella thermophila]QEK12880.1 sodium-dependent transporter [Crassaminicella thermophila]